MFESLIAWLSGLPPVAVYGVIGLLAAFENVFPPLPADTTIAFGAFLSYRGITDPWLVFAVTLATNVGGALVLFQVAVRHSTRLFGTALARRYLTDDGLGRMRRQYDRFGIAGLFLVRMLPGLRVVVAPFAGLIRLGFIRTAIPITIASAIWYGAIVFLATRLGANFDRVLILLDRANSTLLIVSALLVAAAGWAIVRSARRRNR